jgi:hypothetical protein
VWKASSQFDIDESSNEKNSKFDFMIRENTIQKCLESDDLLFIEGTRRQNVFMPEIELKQDKLD